VVASIVKYHDNEANGANRPDTAGPRRPSKSCWPYFNWHPSSATDLFLTSINLGGNTGERAKQPGSPASKSERCVISSFKIAESMGFKGDFRQWEDLLRIGD
jgi:hypothetical protein